MPKSHKTSEIPGAIKTYLNEIAERLWSGHAAVMVGAGFSKNAKNNRFSSTTFPDWNTLGNVFYKKIHGKCPESQWSYLNVLRLADEVQAAFGRPALNQLLHSCIPDKDYDPSDLHIKLMELPWTDVFTTNYDTLLERACDNVESQRFDVVINTEDLVYSEQPRIIKLHGSFPSERPFIITEEDYRKYPKDYAPFVNTVQQSLLENTLCLIGFSGDDPNFLQWTGWIRDNLGQNNSPKIFLLGVFALSDAQKKLLEQRNITLIDLSICPDVNGSHAKALTIFLDYLRYKKKNDNALDWPAKQQVMRPVSQKEIVPQLNDIINEWKKNRKSYPNWAILPEDNRKSLWLYTEGWINAHSYIAELKAPMDFEFIYELNWRLEKCLCPLPNNIIDTYRLIVEKYNPCPDILSMEAASVVRNDKAFENLAWEEIEEKWIKLHISMMRFYREEGHIAEWTNTNNRIQQFYSILSQELAARLHYERCLYALFTLNISDAREQIKSWPVDKSLPFWEAKRAGLKAELGDLDEAEKILELSLSFIRAQCNLSPISVDYSWVSKEACVMFLLQHIKNAAIFRSGLLTKLGEIMGRFYGRWSSLKRYKCDPWGELRLFKNCLEREPSYIPLIAERHEFDIGRVTETRHYGQDNTEAFNAYSFLRYCEETGVPFRLQGIQIATQSAVGAVKRIGNYSPYWACVTFLRTGESKAADILFDRESIQKYSVSRIDRLIEEYLQILNISQTEIEEGRNIHHGNFGAILAEVIPEILSRLSVKCSRNARDQLLDFLKEVYFSDYKHKYKGISNLTQRLLGSYSVAELYSKLPMLLEFPVLINLNPLIKYEYPDPFSFIDIAQEYVPVHKHVTINHAVIKLLLLKVGSKDPDERNRAIHRIVVLYKLSFLSEDQVKEFSDILWSQVDELFGFPENTGFCKHAFINFLPHPDNIDPVPLFKDYTAKAHFPVQRTRAEKGIGMTGGDNPLCREFRWGTKTVFSDDGIDWSEQEAIDVFERLVEWWDADKEYLRKNNTNPFSSVAEEFRKRFANITQLLSYVVIPRLSPQTSIKEELSRLLTELSIYNMPCVATRTASLCVFPEQRQEVFDKIEMAILSKQEKNIIDGYDAILQVCVLHNTNKIAEIPDSIWSHLTSPIRWRCSQNLPHAMRLGINIVHKFPKAITMELLENMLFGLGYLIEETSLQNQQSYMDTAKRLDIRSNAASLAYMLYKYHVKKELPIPGTIEKWKAICDDGEEFSDIRNKWGMR